LKHKSKRCPLPKRDNNLHNLHTIQAVATSALTYNNRKVLCTGVRVNSPKISPLNIDFRAALDALGQAIIIFDNDDHWAMDNLAARTLLGPNLALIRQEGWAACAALLEAHPLRGDTLPASQAREQSGKQANPVRFAAILNGVQYPCWAATIFGSNGAMFTMITLEQPDWTPLHELLETFREEARMAINSTRGHAGLITQLVTKRTEGITVEKLARRVTGFSTIIGEHMFRLQIYMEQLRRLEAIRTGELHGLVRAGRKKVPLSSFLEDFFEELMDDPFMDAEQAGEIRDRLALDVPDNLMLYTNPAYLTHLFRDLLRNAYMYSPKGAAIGVRAVALKNGREGQIDVADSGYGIRARDTERVFAPFQRSTQPQVIAEFGYGLSLYCAKAEVESMNGKLWFQSEEGVGSVFSFKLPLWRG